MTILVLSQLKTLQYEEALKNTDVIFGYLTMRIENCFPFA